MAAARLDSTLALLDLDLDLDNQVCSSFPHHWLRFILSRGGGWFFWHCFDAV